MKSRMSTDQRGWVVAVLIAALGMATCPVIAGDAPYDGFVEKHVAPLVTLKFTLKLKRGSGEQESENEIAGVMIDEKGLVLCSNTELSGGAATFSRMMGAAADIRATPSDIKVLIGDDVEGKDAEVLVRDTELDLAWVRLKEPPAGALPFVDFSKSVKPGVGDRILTVKRLAKFFGRSPIVTEGRVGGIASKPRELFLPAGDLAPELGLPVYTAGGDLVGVTVVQVPDASGGSMNRFEMQKLLSSLQEMGGVILPAEQIVKSTKRALEVADSEE